MCNFMVCYKGEIISLRVSNSILEVLDALVNMEKETRSEKCIFRGREPSRSSVICALILAFNEMSYEEKKKLIHHFI